MVKGIVLAGGHATRLYPLTKVTNKHLLPVGKIPMIYYPIARLIECGIDDILIVTSRDHMGDIVNLLGSGAELGISFTYKVQDVAGGIAQALGLAETFVGNDSCAVILGDNIFTSSFADDIKDFVLSDSGARIILKSVPDPGRYGVAEVSDDGKTVLNIEEKPSSPKSNLAVTGVYFYDSSVFKMIKTLKPSGRGELEITDVNNGYIKKGCLSSCQYSGEWTDAGTFSSLLYANNLVKNIEIPKVITNIVGKE